VCETATGNGICTLRAAVMEANATTGATIVLPALPAPQAYALGIPPSSTNDDQSGDLNLTKDMALVGGGAVGTIIDGGALDRRCGTVRAGRSA